MMEEALGNMSRAYHETVQKLTQMVLVMRPENISVQNVITAMQSAHIDHLQKLHEASQKAVPQKERISFVQHLRNLADAFERTANDVPETT